MVGLHKPCRLRELYRLKYYRCLHHVFIPPGFKSTQERRNKEAMRRYHFRTNLYLYLYFSLNGPALHPFFRIYSSLLAREDCLFQTSKALLLHSSFTPTDLLTEEIAQLCIKAPLSVKLCHILTLHWPKDSSLQVKCCPKTPYGIKSWQPVKELHFWWV